MKYIDEQKINELLTKKSTLNLDSILDKTKKLERLSLEETAFLLNCEDSFSLQKIFDAAKFVKNEIYGKRVVMFTPLYVSNFCVNNCKYCSFRVDNQQIIRKALSPEEIREQVLWLLKRGHKRILLVAGEAAKPGVKLIDYYVSCIEAIYSVEYNGHSIRRVNINCAPLEVEDFKKLKAAKIGTYQIFQETYHDETYKKMHPSGPKNDGDNRISAIDRAFQAGIDDVGFGVLYGLYDYKFETLAMLAHVEALEKKYGVGPHTISVPRLEPAIGVDFTNEKFHFVKDEEFEKIVAVLRLAVPYTGLILSTRETAAMRDKLLSLGISQMSAESSTAPGGYSDENENSQFCVSDHRNLEEMIETILNFGFIPSFCTACYRSNRTGKNFMDLAKPGKIKGKCSLNSLITLKEYLDDFANENLKKRGYELIKKEMENLTLDDKKALEKIFETDKKDKFV